MLDGDSLPRGAEAEDWIAQYDRLDFVLTRVRKGTKSPIDKGWQHAPRPSIDTYREWFVDGYQPGVRLGEASRGLHDVDVDDERLLPFLAALKPPWVGSCPRVVHAERPHFLARLTAPFKRDYFLLLEPDAKGRRTKKMIVQIRGEGQQQLLPPSIHSDDGLPYLWKNGPHEPPLVETAEVVHWVESSVVAFGLSLGWGVGVRHELAMAVAGWLARRGTDRELVRRIVEAAAGDDDDEADDRLRAVDDTFDKAASKMKTTGWPTLQRLLPNDVVELLKDVWPPSGVSSSTGSEPQEGARIRTVGADEVTPTPVVWLWRGFVARGKVNLSAGSPGIGKSTVKLDIAARVTRGADMPDGSPGVLGNVLVFSAEDDAADTIVPRLIAAGADRCRVRIEQGVVGGDGLAVGFNLRDHARALEHLIRETEAVYAIFDPLSAYVGRIDTHRDSEARQMLRELFDVAGRTGCAIDGLVHLNKATELPSLMRVLGSVAFGAAARVVTATAEDPEQPGQFAFGPIKVNVGKKAPPLAYTIDGALLDGEAVVPPGEVVPLSDGTLSRMRLYDGGVVLGGDSLIETSRITWLGPSSLDLDGAIEGRKRAGGGGGPRLEEAKEFLREILAAGERLEVEVRAAADAKEISWATVLRAKKELGLKSRKQRKEQDAEQRWVWSLPEVHTP